MQPAAAVALLWIVFAGTHVGLAIGPIRGAIVARLGETGFRAVFSVVAVASFTALVTYYAAHRFDGAAGLDLARHPAVRAVLLPAVFAGVVLMLLMDYPRSPTALFDQPIGTPRGLERITRHPFFAGAALLGMAHALLASRLVGTVFFAGLAALAIAGSRHQDRKLLARRGPPYGEYLAATSAIPFAAILAGRQCLPRREIPLPMLAVAVGLAVLLRAVHGSILARGGVWLVGAVVLGAAVSTLRAWRRSRRLGAALRPAFQAAPAP
jgi:uncharacterized membrane protein